MTTDTIFAPASGLGKCAIAIVRISGPLTEQVLKGLTGREALEPRKALLVPIRVPATGEVIDKGIVLWFSGPASFSGEDMGEIHVHGGDAVLEKLLQTLNAEKGLRMAAPGEFTRRAFDNGKMDLTEVEGLADLIAAETEGQRVQALRQMEGQLSAVYNDWRTRILKILALQEAEIDFSDQDLPEGLSHGMTDEARQVVQEMRNHLGDHRRGERLRHGFRVTLLGAPNAGKSSLINALAKRDVSIVSSLAGTTRDILETHLDIHGLPVTFADTAGLAESTDEIEIEGIRRARERAEDSDLVLHVMAPDLSHPQNIVCLSHNASRGLVIINKADLLGNYPDFENEVRGSLDSSYSAPIIKISALKGDGLADLLEAVSGMLVEGGMSASFGAPALTRARHRAHLERTLEYLNQYLAAADSTLHDNSAPQPELLAEELRSAVHHLGAIVGFVDVEEVLGIIFQEFCIGK